MTEKFSYDVMHSVLMAPELQDIKNRNKLLNEKVENVFSVNNKVLGNFNESFKCFLKKEDIKKDILLLKEPAEASYDLKPFFTDEFKIKNNINDGVQLTNKYVTLSVRKNRIGTFVANDNYSFFSQLPCFRTFSYIEYNVSMFSYIKYYCASFSLFNPLYTNEICSILNDDGLEVFDKLSNSWYNNSPGALDKLKFSYKISDITKKEKELFKIRSEDAYLYFKINHQQVMIFLANGFEAKGPPYPDFYYREFADDYKELNHVNEKLFILNHYDDISTALTEFEKRCMPKVDTHIKYLEESDKILEKYVLAARL